MALPELAAAHLPAEAWADRPLTQLGRALDAAVVRAMQLVIDATLMPSPDDVPRLRESAAPYVRDDLGREPRRFFAFLDEPAAWGAPSGRYVRSLPGGVAIARRFRSDYQRFHGDERPAPENTVIPVEHWMHDPRRPRPTVLAVHGFVMGQPRLDAFALFAPHWFRHGLDVALITLPFHGVRAPLGSRFSGEAFASQDLGQINEAVRQGIHDLRLVGAWLSQQRGTPVGLLGLSLGGYLTALMAGLTDEFAFVVPIVPPVCMGDLAWRFVMRSRRRNGHGAGPVMSRDELRQAYRLHSPLAYPLRMGRERVLIVAGRGDQIVPPEHPHALWRHWGEPAIHWFSGSHLAPFGRRGIVQAVLRHLQSIDVL